MLTRLDLVQKSIDNLEVHYDRPVPKVLKEHRRLLHISNTIVVLNDINAVANVDYIRGQSASFQPDFIGRQLQEVKQCLSTDAGCR